MAATLLDTDVFIDHLRGARRLVLADEDVSYSVVTRCELFAGSRADETVLQTILAPFRELAIDRRVAERAGRIRRETGTLIADALIAATALENGLELMTRNVRDFERIAGLRLVSPAS